MISNIIQNDSDRDLVLRNLDADDKSEFRSPLIKSYMYYVANFMKWATYVGGDSQFRNLYHIKLELRACLAFLLKVLKPSHTDIR